MQLLAHAALLRSEARLRPSQVKLRRAGENGRDRTWILTNHISSEYQFGTSRTSLIGSPPGEEGRQRIPCSRAATWSFCLGAVERVSKIDPVLIQLVVDSWSSDLAFASSLTGKGRGRATSPRY